MPQNLTENQWTYASRTMRELAESQRTVNLSADQRDSLCRELVSWSQATFEIRGYYQLDEEMIDELLESAHDAIDSNRGGSTLSVITEGELANLGVSEDGAMVLQLTATASN